jgi:hypothetical protein
MFGKSAKVRVTIQNIGYGTANNFTIQSMQPNIVSTTNPNLKVGFNITGSSNTAESTGYLPGNLTINFGNIAPGAAVSGYWTMQVTQNGFFIDVSSTYSQVDYQGVQLDPLVLPPTITLIPAIGGYVTSDTGQIIPNMTVSAGLSGPPVGPTVGSDLTDLNGVFYIPDLMAGPSGTYYQATITDSFGKVWLTKTIGVLGDQGTSLITFVIVGINAQPITITSNPSGQPFTFAGQNYATPQTLQGFNGSTYTINFANVSQGTGARYALTGWSDGPTANPRTITVGMAPATYNANFGTQYLLSLTTTPPGAGSITASPTSPDGYYNALGTQSPAIPMKTVLTVNKSGNGTGTVTSSSGINCTTTCSTMSSLLAPGNTVTLNAVADPGMSFNGWTGDCALSPNVPPNPMAIVDSNQDRTCTASFIVAAKISLSPYGNVNFSSLNYSNPQGPYFVQVVAPDGVTQIHAPLTITVNITKEVMSPCNVFLSNLTVVIPAGTDTGALDFVAGLDWCDGTYSATTTEWIINSVLMGPSNIRLPTVAGQSILTVLRSATSAISTPSIQLTWGRTNPIAVPSNGLLIHQGPSNQVYNHSYVNAATSLPGGSFSWTSSDPTVVAVLGGSTSNQVVITGNQPGTSTLTVQYTLNGANTMQSVNVQVIYPILLVHGIASGASTWGQLSTELSSRGLLQGTTICTSMSYGQQSPPTQPLASDIDYCAADFESLLPPQVGAAGELVAGNQASFVTEGQALVLLCYK